MASSGLLNMRSQNRLFWIFAQFAKEMLYGHGGTVFDFSKQKQ